MRFRLSSEQRQFGAAIHELLADAEVPAAARAWANGDHGPGLAIWQALAKAGVTALAVPEAAGGLGASPVDLVVACEELGHHPVPGPIAESLAAIPALLATLTPRAQQHRGKNDVAITTSFFPRCAPAPQGGGAAGGSGADGGGGAGVAGGAGGGAIRVGGWLRALAEGELIGTLAVPPALPYALDADRAGLVLLAQAGQVSLAAPGTSLGSIDPARRLSGLRASEVIAAGAGAAIQAAIQHGTLASAALLLGAGRGLLEASAAYAKTREQFGKPVGAFQAVKHSLANVLISLEFARPLAYAAAVALGAGAPTAARDLSAARVACADAARLAARTALQVHGAIGYTRECDISLWLAKVRALSSTWGSQAEHRATVLAALTAPGTGPWS
jgi:alkylation response protein AidB-like acyl-CoA dehydrogenase